MTQTRNQRPDGGWAWDVLWVGLLALYAFAGYPVTPFHGDESMQIFMSHDYAYQFIERDMAKIFYDETRVADVEQGLRLLNGTVNKYTIGAAWHAAGFTVDDLNWPWYWEHSYQFNMDHGFYPGDDLLLTSRIPSSLFLSGSVIGLFLAAFLFAGRPAAYMTSLYYALNPAVLLNGRRAMMEGSLLFGLALTLLAGVLLVRGRGWRAWGAALLLALAAGIAVASKHTNVVTVFAVFAGVLVYAVVEARRDGWRLFAARIGQLFAAGVLSIGLFLALNPAWWDNPIARASYVLDARVELLGGQIEIFDGYETTGEKLAGFYRQVFINQPMYFEAESFREPMAAQAATYEATPYAGVHLDGVHLVMAALFVMGLLCLFNVLHVPDIHPAARWVVGSFVTVMTLFAVFATPLEWQRYYLTAYPAVALVAPLGILWVVRLYARDAAAHSPQYRKGSARVNA